MQTLFPILRYNDARAAIRRLASVFGFAQVFSVPESDDVRHAPRKLGKNLIMDGLERPNDGIVNPKGLGWTAEMLAVYVEDPGAHFARAQARSANILSSPTNTDFESRRYQAPDLKGPPGTLGTYYPAVESARMRE